MAINFNTLVYCNDEQVIEKVHQNL